MSGPTPTVLNSYVQPVVARYLSNLEDSLRQVGVGAQLYAMASNGGVMSFSQAKRAPIHVVESGPVAGAIGAREIGESIGESNLLTLDVGGTTAKTTLILKGQLRINSDYFIEKTPTSAGYPLSPRSHGRLCHHDRIWVPGTQKLCRFRRGQQRLWPWYMTKQRFPLIRATNHEGSSPPRLSCLRRNRRVPAPTTL